jgi:hypothetical protein
VCLLNLFIGCQPEASVGSKGRCSTADNGLASTSSALYGASPACMSIGAWQDAVGYLLVVRDGDVHGDPIGCTLSRVAPGVAVTARHCFPDQGTWTAIVGFASPIEDVTGCGRGQGESKADAVLLHPDVDVALVYFPQQGKRPILPMGESDPLPGTSVVLAGYGRTETGSWGERRCLATLLEATDPLLDTRSPDSGKGACVGDSGGPLIAMADDAGIPALQGILSDGSASCTGRDRYVSVASLQAWLTSGIDAGAP